MITYGLFLYIILTAVVVFLAFGIGTVSKKDILTKNPYTSRLTARNRIIALAIFILLSSVSVCRIAVGNDYWVYRDNFNLIAQDRHVSYEIGFRYVVKFLQWFLDYDNYLPIFAFFSLMTVFLMVKSVYDQSEWFVFSLFIFMTAGYYFGSLNNVRYYLALSAAMYSIKYVLKKDYIKFIALIAFAALFHKSVLIVIPLYLLATVNWNWIGHTVIGAFCATLLFFPGLYRRIIFIFYPFYEGSMFDTGQTSLTNIAKAAAVFIFALIYREQVKEDKNLKFGFYCNLWALLLYVFCSFMPEISRIGFYLNITNIFFIPALIRRIENKKARTAWTVLICIAFIAFFALFLKSAYNTDVRILPYYNWIFQ
ncbi:MAG: EpsG family protein [Lachnospiraceae bacterium]|nr:EpsG family protein [Lachnospiraceae bacterium]